MRIDSHAHVLPREYIDAIPQPGGNLPKPPIVTVEMLEGVMERYAIDRAVVSVGPPGLFFGDQSQAAELGRLVNETMASIRDREPDRFAALGMIPLPDVDGALAELTHLLDTLRLDGVVLTTHVAGTYLGDTAWEPLYAELDRRGAYVFLHPTIPANGVALAHPAWLYEFPFDTVRALANLIYAGTFERYPNIRWQIAHLGGAAPFLAHRLASLTDREPAQAEAAPAGTLAYLSRLYYDTGLSNNEIATGRTWPCPTERTPLPASPSSATTSAPPWMRPTSARWCRAGPRSSYGSAHVCRPGLDRDHAGRRLATRHRRGRRAPRQWHRRAEAAAARAALQPQRAAARPRPGADDPRRAERRQAPLGAARAPRGVPRPALRNGPSPSGTGLPTAGDLVDELSPGPVANFTHGAGRRQPIVYP
jgi:predicted TIM-barrel fold metal-dependent hydrolase